MFKKEEHPEVEDHEGVAGEPQNIQEDEIPNKTVDTFYKPPDRQSAYQD